jgi:hypothetical protein
MLIISRQNNKVHYSYEMSPKRLSYSGLSLAPIPIVNRRSINEVSIDKWYIVQKDVIDQIIDLFIETFYDYTGTITRYKYYFNENEFRNQMIKNLYNSSQSKNKYFI